MLKTLIIVALAGIIVFLLEKYGLFSFKAMVSRIVNWFKNLKNKQ